MENSERPQINSKKILVLDDDHDLLELLHDAFILYGFDVDAYSDHISALKSFGSRSEQYDAVLMGLRLDRIDGRQIYKKFKEFDSDSKIYVFTALEVDVAEFKEICPSFEEKFLIKKPIRISSMVQTIKSLLD
jgi:DNA-binding response OmpR family regulator